MNYLTYQPGPDNRYQDGDYDGPPSLFDSDTVDKRSIFLDPTTFEYSGDYVPSNDTLDELKDLSYQILDDRSQTPGGVYYSPKKVTICGTPKISGPSYPAYPSRPDIDWETGMYPFSFFSCLGGSCLVEMLAEMR